MGVIDKITGKIDYSLFFFKILRCIKAKKLWFISSYRYLDMDNNAHILYVQEVLTHLL